MSSLVPKCTVCKETIKFLQGEIFVFLFARGGKIFAFWIKVSKLTHYDKEKGLH